MQLSEGNQPYYMPLILLVVPLKSILASFAEKMVSRVPIYSKIKWGLKVEACMQLRIKFTAAYINLIIKNYVRKE